MSFRVQSFGSAEWAEQAATVVGPVLPAGGAVVLTGGDAAASLYPKLAVFDHDWSHTDVLFSDERVVPPDDPASNYRMASELLLSVRPPRHIHRVRGEDRPHDAADEYSRAIEHIMERGPDVMLLGLGADAHIASLFPLSPVFDDGGGWSQAVTRPDGLHGVTLTPRALLHANKVFLIVVGAEKAGAVRRAVRGTEEPRTCPVRVLADHPDATLLIDEAAAAEL